MVFYIEDLQQKRIPIDEKNIKEKAIIIYKRLQEVEPSTSLQVTKKPVLNTSEEWLIEFLKRQAFHNVKVKGEVASADEIAANSFTNEPAQIIEQGGCTPDQIFNPDETGLFCKKMSARTYQAKSEKSVRGFKTAKDRLTLILCSNVTGGKILNQQISNATSFEKQEH